MDSHAVALVLMHCIAVLLLAELIHAHVHLRPCLKELIFVSPDLNFHIFTLVFLVFPGFNETSEIP